LGFGQFLRHPQIQTSIKSSPAGSYLRDANGLERPAHFIRLEHLQQDLVTLEDHLGFRLGKIPVENVSERHKDHRIYYDSPTAELVGNLCKEDISRFGYVF